MSSISASASSTEPAAVGSGPDNSDEARSRRSFSADSDRAYTAVVMLGAGIAELERVLRRPASGALLLGLVEDDVDEG